MLTIQSLHDRVAQIYYTYGLFCASHPLATIISVILSVFITCYPLINLPLPGNRPIEHRTPKAGFVPLLGLHSQDGIHDERKPRWLVGEPVAYIQQIVVKSTVSPWPQTMIASDAFRAPLASVFKIVSELEQFKSMDGSKEVSIADNCYRISEPLKARHLQGLLPDYSCLLISPANFWNQDITKYNKDPDILKTMYRKFGQVVESPPSTKDLLFGLPWSQTGITRYYVRNRQRIISYAVTIVLRKYDAGFISALSKMLEEHHPDTLHNVNNSAIEDIVHVHFKDVNYIIEYTPLLVTYLVLLLYLYFSVCKIDMVKSKIGLAISAVVTVLASLLMSVSICTLFGMTPTLNGGEIFPYLAVIVGVENVLVITKSVVSTPVHLDVKIRVAQGLSKEGWSITKNLVTELAIVLVGFFTFVPAIQEFCAFALVGLLSDFYLQMAFFATVLSVDIRRMELSDLHRQSVQQSVQDYSNMPYVNIQPLVLCPVASRQTHVPPRSHSVPPPDPSSVFPPVRQQGHITPPPSPSLPTASNAHYRPETSSDRPKYEMPRRVKFFYFLARFRIVQKLIMVFTVIWIILIFYKAGLVVLTGDDTNTTFRTFPSKHNSDIRSGMDPLRSDDEIPYLSGKFLRDDEEVGPVIHTDLELWRRLSTKHWPLLFHYYNISLSGRYISLLPTIHLSEIIDPKKAIMMRHPSDAESVLPPISIQETNPENDSQEGDRYPQFKHFYPKSEREYFFTVLLCILTVIIITYFMIYLYRCMCSRNYSRWRHSWIRSANRRARVYVKQIKESVPLVLSGHSQNIECLLGDNGLIISSCLGGQLKIWDSNSGECINTISRKNKVPLTRRRPCVGRNIEDSDADLYAEYHGSRSSSETSLADISGSGGAGDGVRIRRGNFSWTEPGSGRLKRTGNANRISHNIFQDLRPDLISTVNTEFSSLDPKMHQSSRNGYDFKHWFEGLYEEHRRYLEAEGQVSNIRTSSANDVTALITPYERLRSWSYGEQSALDVSNTDEDIYCEQLSPVWCLASMHGLIVLGCGNGHIEVWEAETGELRFHNSIHESGVTGLCVIANKIVAARLDGTLDFLEMETFRNPVIQPTPLLAQCPRQNSGHSRSYSNGSADGIKMWDEVIRCAGVTTCRAHQLPINVIHCAGGRIVTASQDHTLKVFRLDNALCLYTLHGHEASVTALCLDQVAPFAAVSGSIDGTVRMWDLLTGTCIHKFCWHSSSVVTLTMSQQYIVSLGFDNTMCIWDRSKSTLLHSIKMNSASAGIGCAALLSRNLIVTGGQGSIFLWDIPRGSLLRKVDFVDNDQKAFVNHLVTVSNNGVVCDQGQDLKVVFFPTILEKAE
ncbi:sterol regulatory element-binding protein cleavage-activating protein-like isoform X1 [Biomphalaria pfeifferi]|uniref:Sterol regulatory element-binding protein cleavage-activating protein n=1 Tax=Biomphalaria pfeifferi TaxID=112525 RepID=A0AAD8BMM3_BIOPF|nr:sterol regulatory element-binding protein cleavage-activating protein-like isoform X1 [Biomphalaria pfeifferi]